MTTKKLLNLGCGARFHEDWTNVDVMPTDSRVLAHDLTQILPFHNDSFDFVYHSHVLEHLPRNDALNFLKETHRVLKEGGITRVVVPDLERQAREYLKTLEDSARSGLDHDWMLLEMVDQLTRLEPGGEMAKFLRQQPQNAQFIIQRIGREGEDLIFPKKAAKTIKSKPLKIWISKLIVKTQGLLIRFFLGSSAYRKFQIGNFKLSGESHQWMYDRISLEKILKSIGYKSVRQVTATESGWSEFYKYELDSAQGKVHKPDSLFVEAVK